MKRITILSIMAVLILSMGIVAFADSSQDVPQWHKDMIQWRKEQVNEAVINGEVTEEDAKYWIEEIDRMQEYNNEYGYGSGMMGQYGIRNSRGSRGNSFMGGFGSGFCNRW